MIDFRKNRTAHPGLYKKYSMPKECNQCVYQACFNGSDISRYCDYCCMEGHSKGQRVNGVCTKFKDKRKNKKPRKKGIMDL